MGLRIEERLSGTVALVAEGLVVAIWEFEGARRSRFRGFDI